MNAEKFSLVLSTENWWQQIEDVANKKNWGGEFVAMIRCLITAHLSNCITPEASDFLIFTAKHQLPDGIKLGDRCFDIAVCAPKQVTLDRRRFFVLIPKYPDSRILRLEEFSI